MSSLIVALVLFTRVTLILAPPTGVVLNDGGMYITCSGEDSLPSSLVISDKIHPLHGAIILSFDCDGDADHFDASYPFPVDLNIWYVGNRTEKCVFKETPSAFEIDVDLLAYGEYSIGSKTITCPKPKASTPALVGDLPDYPSINIPDMRPYVWSRCGAEYTYLEFIPLVVKAIASVECKDITRAYTIETDTPVEVMVYVSGNTTNMCVFKEGDPRTVEISFFKYSTFEYFGTGTMKYCLPRHDTYILNVIPHCGDAVGDPAWVSGITDVDADFRAICKNDQTYIFENLNRDYVNYKLPVLYTGNPNTSCVFNKRENSHVYVITVLASWGERGAVVHKHKQEYQMTCTFDAKGRDESDDQIIADTLIAPKVIQMYDGSVGQSYISLHLMDVLDRQVYSLPMGRLVRLRAWSNGRGSELGIRTVGCDVIGVNSGQRFAIVRAGCGDGILFGKNQGFTTNGLNSTSPYFKAFSMHSDPQVKFECNFTMCTSNCDGSSCENEPSEPLISRRKRSHKYLYFSDHVFSRSYNITL